MPDISIVMIVKNEAHQIEDALRSFDELLPELVVVDTGSTDDTRSLAARAGAQVHDFEWVDDFSAARNFALLKATGKYILIADADDRLASGEAVKILKLVEQGTDKVCFFRVQDQQTGENFPSIRFWPRDREIRYVGRVHEEPVLPDREYEPQDTVFTDVKLEHLGYTDALIQEKHLRNIKLLERALEEQPTDPKIIYYLAKQFDAIKEPEKAIMLYEQLASDSNMHFNPMICRNLANLLEQNGEYSKALEIVLRGITLFPDYSDLHCLAGLVHYRLGMLADSIESYRSAIELGEGVGAFSQLKGAGSHIAWRGLGFSYQALGDNENAMQSFSHAIALDPTDELSGKQIKNILMSVYGNSEKDAEEYLVRIRGTMT